MNIYVRVGLHINLVSVWCKYGARLTWEMLSKMATDSQHGSAGRHIAFSIWQNIPVNILIKNYVKYLSKLWAFDVKIEIKLKPLFEEKVSKSFDINYFTVYWCHNQPNMLFCHLCIRIVRWLWLSCWCQKIDTQKFESHVLSFWYPMTWCQ